MRGPQSAPEPTERPSAGAETVRRAGTPEPPAPFMRGSARRRSCRGAATLDWFPRPHSLCGPWWPSVNNKESGAPFGPDSTEARREPQRHVSPVFLLCLLLFAANASLRSFAAFISTSCEQPPAPWLCPPAASDPDAARGCPRKTQKDADRFGVVCAFRQIPNLDPQQRVCALCCGSIPRPRDAVRQGLHPACRAVASAKAGPRAQRALQRSSLAISGGTSWRG